ncbi:MAG TPA: AMP-binding protein, partial [Burkholderiaceae bacterium]|nr:AMP-binding protein [Burkholderiaceae bacterium]
MEKSAHIDTYARDHLPPLDEWPELLLDGNPDVAYPPRLNCAVALVDDLVAAGHGDRIALHWREGSERRSMSYRRLMELCNQIAHVLVEDLGLVPGNRVLLRGPNNVMMAATWLAAVKAGLVTVPTMPLLRAGELKKIIDKAKVQAVL